MNKKFIKIFDSVIRLSSVDRLSQAEVTGDDFPYKIYYNINAYRHYFGYKTRQARDRDFESFEVALTKRK